MLKNYIKTTFRNLIKYKGYSLINILGLAVGIACCILILLFVRNELSYDTFHEKKDRLYRLYSTFVLSSGRSLLTPNFPIPFAPALAREFPEIAATVRFQDRTGVVRAGDNLVREDLLFCDPAILQAFSFPLILGNSETALNAPGAIVLSEEMAQKYFGDQDALGEEMFIRLNEEELAFQVTGVARRVPENSSIKFNFLAPFNRLLELSSGMKERENDWSSFSTVTFALLHESSKPADLAAKLPAFSDKYFAENEMQIMLQPLTDIHLNPEIGSGGLEPVSDPKYSYILAGIALIVLLIACINFMTITLGRSTSRAREVGMRKVLGAHRWQLLKQFWGEALLMSFLALILGVAIAEAFLPAFNSLTEKQLTLNFTSDALTLAGLFALTLITGLVAGGYPALVLSKYRSVEVFKGNLKLGRTTFGKVLVVTQFSLAIFLIVCTIIMSRQKDYLMTKNLGFTGEQVLVIPTIRVEDGERLLRNFRSELAPQPQFVNVTGASYSFRRGYHRVSSSYEDHNIRTYEYRVDYDYLQTLKIELLRGRNFSPEFPTDVTDAAIVNQAFVQEMGWQEPLGKTFTFRGMRPLTVVGVVKNYHFDSLHESIAPVVLHLDANTPLRYLLVRVRPTEISAALDILANTWKKLAPELPFEFYFLNNDIEKQYEAEKRWGRIVTYSSVFAVAISCLGLFGLSALSVARRTKEIGIRKVLGASVNGLVGLLSREFLLLVALGNIIAWPAAYLAVSKWLETFAYRIEIGIVSFLAAALLALLVALATVSFQAIKAAVANPVEALRYE